MGGIGLQTIVLLKSGGTSEAFATSVRSCSLAPIPPCWLPNYVLQRTPGTFYVSNLPPRPGAAEHGVRPCSQVHYSLSRSRSALLPRSRPMLRPPSELSSSHSGALQRPFVALCASTQVVPRQSLVAALPWLLARLSGVAFQLQG